MKTGLVQALWRSAPLIQFLFSELYLLFACLYHMLARLSFFLHFFLLVSSLTYPFL